MKQLTDQELSCGHLQRKTIQGTKNRVNIQMYKESGQYTVEGAVKRKGGNELYFIINCFNTLKEARKAYNSYKSITS